MGHGKDVAISLYIIALAALSGALNQPNDDFLPLHRFTAEFADDPNVPDERFHYENII